MTDRAILIFAAGGALALALFLWLWLSLYRRNRRLRDTRVGQSTMQESRLRQHRSASSSPGNE